MIPHVAQRGSSFKGAASYYLHDKQSKTNERVSWTYTHNLPTMDAAKGFNYMASTAIQAEVLKHRSGIKNTGRKSKNKPVYSFSLSWHPEQDPEKSVMQSAALEVLSHLGLSDHEAVFVAHNDEPHPHIHVIANLVHPENGKTASMSYDRLTLSKWAEEFEREGGKIYCEVRVENNKKRRENVNDNRSLRIVKHKESRLDRATLIQSIYKQAHNTEVFQESLEKEGYTLAMGRKGRVVLVDSEGSIYALSRQLKGQRAKDIREKLDNLNTLPKAQILSEGRKQSPNKEIVSKHPVKLNDKGLNRNLKKESLQAYRSYADEMDATWAKKATESRNKLIKEKNLRAFYKRETYLKNLNKIKEQSQKAILPSKKKQLTEQIRDLELTIANIDQRMKEQGIEPQNLIYKNYQSHVTEAKSDNSILKPFEKSADLKQKLSDINKSDGQSEFKKEFHQKTKNLQKALGDMDTKFEKEKAENKHHVDNKNVKVHHKTKAQINENNGNLNEAKYKESNRDYEPGP